MHALLYLAAASITIITTLRSSPSYFTSDKDFPFLLPSPKGMESQIEPQAITVITIINPKFITTVIITTASWASDASLSKRSLLPLPALAMPIIKVPVINDDYRQTGTLTHNGVLIPRI